MKITVNNKEYNLHYSYRMFKIYEGLANKSFDVNNVMLEDIEYLFYGAIISTLLYNDKDTTNLMKYVDYQNWIDDNGGEKIFVDFLNWYIEQTKIQNDLLPESTKDKLDEPNELNQEPNF